MMYINEIIGEDWDGDEYGVYCRTFVQSYYADGHIEPTVFLEAIRAHIDGDEEGLEKVDAATPRHSYLAGHATPDGSEVWETSAERGQPITTIDMYSLL